MKVIVVGAGGRLGARILPPALAAGHQVTAFVRSSERLRAAVGDGIFHQLAVVEGDAADRAQLAEAMRGHEAAVQVSGYIGKTYEESEPLHRIVVAVTEAANEALVDGRRLWVTGGAATLDLPGRGLMLVDVPGFPFQQYRMHKTNLEFLSLPEFASLDWSFACPGSMTEGPPGGLPPAPARVTADVLPAALPSWAALLPNVALLPAVATLKGQLVGPSYAEVAGAIVENLAPKGPLRHKRVGFAAAPAGPA